MVGITRLAPLIKNEGELLQGETIFISLSMLGEGGLIATNAFPKIFLRLFML